MACLFCTKPVKVGKDMLVVETAVKTETTHQKVWRGDGPPDEFHEGCYRRMTRRYRRRNDDVQS